MQGLALPLLVFGRRRCVIYCMATRRDFPICVNYKQPNLFDIREETMALLLPSPRRAARASDEERSTLTLLPNGCSERMAAQWESHHR
jgi:hypothetical protein